MRKYRIIDRILLVVITILLLLDIFSDSPSSIINYMNYLYVFCFSANVAIWLFKHSKMKFRAKHNPS